MTEGFDEKVNDESDFRHFAFRRGAVLAMAACNKRQKDSAETWEDTDMRNSKKSTGWKVWMQTKCRKKKDLHSWTPHTVPNGSQTDFRKPIKK